MEGDDGGDEDDDLAMALALSRADGGGEGAEDVEMEDVRPGDEGEDDEEGMTEEEAIARAIEMSMKEQQK